MRHILLALLVSVVPVLAEDLSATIKQEAQKCADALVKSDLDDVVLYTHKRVIEGMGGKEAMTATIKRGMEQMKAQGVGIEKAIVGEPGKTQKIDTWTVALIPNEIFMKVPGGKLEQDSHLLGISEDDGKSWVFIDVGSISKEQFDQVFPELAGKIDLPEKEKPVFKKDE